MKKQLNIYSDVEGLSDYDEWSYCQRNGMWYEDAKEELPKPFFLFSERVKDFNCQVYVDCWVCGDNYNGADIQRDEDSSLSRYAQYVLGADDYENTTDVALRMQTTKQDLGLDFNEYGMWGVEKFIAKLKSQPFAAQYIEEYSAVKLIAWSNEKNRTRFIVQAYSDHEANLGRTIFDITLSRDLLVDKLEKALNEWKKQVLQELQIQYKKLKGKVPSAKISNAVKHFFPDFAKSIES